MLCKPAGSLMTFRSCLDLKHQCQIGVGWLNAALAHHCLTRVVSMTSHSSRLSATVTQAVLMTYIGYLISITTVAQLTSQPVAARFSRSWWRQKIEDWRGEEAGIKRIPTLQLSLLFSSIRLAGIKRFPTERIPLYSFIIWVFAVVLAADWLSAEATRPIGNSAVVTYSSHSPTDQYSLTQLLDTFQSCN